MDDQILWEYLEELPEQETAWNEWCRRLSGWHCFNTFYTHYLRVENKRAGLLECATPCGHGCQRRVVENSPSDISTICPLDKSAPIQLKFRDILIYSLRREAFHQSLCLSLKIEQLPENKWPECGNAWYLGNYSSTTVYLTYRTAAATLTETINLLCQLCRKPFVLMTPTGHGLVPEAQQLLAGNDSVLLSMAVELRLQPDGLFKPLRGIPECLPFEQS